MLTYVIRPHWVNGTNRPISQSHNAPVPYPTMHHFVTKMCTFLLQNDALLDICLMHYEICDNIVGISLFLIQHQCIVAYFEGCCTNEFPKLYTEAPNVHFKNAYKRINLGALKYSLLNKLHIFKCMGKIFCVEFQKGTFEILHKISYP